MPNALRCSSSLSRASLVVFVAGALGLAGCSSAPRWFKRHDASSAAAAPAMVAPLASRPVASDVVSAPLPPTVATPPIAVAAAGEQRAPISPPVTITPARDTVAPPSRWCEYIKEDSAAEATMLRAPTLSGSVNDKGDAGVGLALSLSSLHKANLMEQAADVKCRRYAAEMGLQKIIFLTPQGLTTAGYRAKADAIFGERRAMADLKAEIRRQLAAGVINKEKATQLSVMVDQLSADANQAKSQADRRLMDEAGPQGDARRLGLDLLQAEADMEDLNSRMRTTDAVDVSLHAGWNQNDMVEGYDSTNDSFTGKVSFSMKLGAFNPRRYEHEARAKDAKLASLREEEGGALWQIAVLRRAHERAMDGLSESRQKLATATSEAERLVAALRDVHNPEFSGTLIAARIQVIKLKAETAGVDGSLGELKASMNRLQAG